MQKLLSSALIVFSTFSFAQTLTPLTWNTYTVKDPQKSAGFIDVADFNNDGKKEIVLSTLMESGNAGSPSTAKGAIRIFSMPSAGISGTWTEQLILPTSQNLPFCNTPQVFDVDGDGIKDVMLQQGFLQTNGGSHQWLKGPNYTVRNNFAPQTTHGSTYYFWHESEQVDLDGDGLLDIVTTSAQTQDANTNGTNTLTNKNAKIEWYRNLGSGNFQYYQLNDSLGGVFIKAHDIDHDGDKDIIVSQFFWNTNRPALVWLENVANPSSSNSYLGSWNYHVIDNTTGLGYYFEFYDIDNDGDEDLVYDNHNNEDNTEIVDGNGNRINPGLYWFEIPTNPATSSQWTKHIIYDGFRTNLFDFGNPSSQGTPGIFSIGDIDLNGLPDIAVPGDGNDSLYIFRQRANHTWQKEIVDIGKMFGQTKLVDLDGNGKLELVAAKHNFPNGFFDLLFPPDGFLKIYSPSNVFVGLDEQIGLGKTIVFPNPCNNLLQIENNIEGTNLTICDVLGKIVLVKNGLAEKETIEVSSFNQGLYFIQLSNKTETRTIKFIKE